MQLARNLTLRVGGLAMAIALVLGGFAWLLGGTSKRAPSSPPMASQQTRQGQAEQAKAEPGKAAEKSAKRGGSAPAAAVEPPSSAAQLPAQTAQAAAAAAGPPPGGAAARATETPAGESPAPLTTTALADRPKPEEDRERVEADVSTRSVAVTSAFTGVEIVVFGSVLNSRSESAESGLYDVVVVLEGAPSPLITRKKSNVAGLWINTSSVTMESIPSYYAIASTRPLGEVAEPQVLDKLAIGFEHMRIAPLGGTEKNVSVGDLADFKEAVIRLKKKEGVFFARDYAVAFIGRSLFRATIALPANVPVGALSARVHLFKEGEHLSSYTAKVKLEREGLGRLLHGFAFNQPMLYGIFTVIIAVAAGLLASTLFRKAGSH